MIMDAISKHSQQAINPLIETKAGRIPFGYVDHTARFNFPKEQAHVACAPVIALHVLHLQDYIHSSHSLVLNDKVRLRPSG